MKTGSLLVIALALAGCRPPPTPEGTPAPTPTPARTSTPTRTLLRHYDVRASSLPAPNTSPDADNGPNVIPRPDGATLTLPDGFTIRPLASGGWKEPRWMALAPNGDVFVVDSQAGTITVLRDADGDGTAEGRFVFATGLNKPFGVAFFREWLYVGNTDAVVRFRYRAGQTAAEGAPEKITDLPGRGYREHWTRNVAIRPDGSKMYVTVGSQSNVDVEAEPRASILEMNVDGSARRTFASGTRNPIGLAFHPTTGALWAAVQERDRLGDDLVPDYVTEVKDGGFYGWPFAYAGPREDPRRKGERPDLVAKTIEPDVMVEAHSAVLGLVFYDGAMFPSEYRGDAFVAFHGSWNRTKRTGYKVVRVKMKDGRPVGGYDDFVTGWMLDESSPDVWGRPVGLLVAKDGALLVCDDGGGLVWRIARNK